jgi:hypothetical protein
MNFDKWSIIFSIKDCRHKSRDCAYKYSFCSTSALFRILVFPYRASRSYSDDTRGTIPLDERSARRREPLPEDTEHPQLSKHDLLHITYQLLPCHVFQQLLQAHTIHVYTINHLKRKFTTDIYITFIR